NCLGFGKVSERKPGGASGSACAHLLNGLQAELFGATLHHNLSMYKIIGADQKEYGPVSVEQLRQWIAEGRVNAQTLVRPEGETEWKPLSAFPDFADTPGVAAATGPALSVGRSVAIPLETVQGRDYELDIGSCIVRGWELVKQNFGPVVGISLLILVISGV